MRALLLSLVTFVTVYERIFPLKAELQMETIELYRIQKKKL